MDRTGRDGDWAPLPAVHPSAAAPAPPRAGAPSTVRKDGREWRVGTADDVGWIDEGTTIGVDITSAIPPVFAAYATVVVPDKEDGRVENAHHVVRLLREESGEQPWWLGYLDTGADDLVFPEAPPVTLYPGWRYVLVLAGPDQALRWRQDLRSWRAPGPDLVFPADRSWLVSWLWDDDWRCVGGSTTLVDRLLEQPDLEVRRVRPGEDATPPGHVAR